jgi:acetyltransferase-like isoleucine patch superfamily enzyme
MYQNTEMQIGKNFSLTSSLMLNPIGRNLRSMFRLDKGAKVIIGDNVGMSCVTLWAKENIMIGNNVKLGSGVIIIDSDMHSLDFKLRRNPNTDTNNSKSKEVIIKDDVFIGLNSIITKGVIIGERSIIAAGSVVVKNIPNDEIWGGNPAKFIRKIHG